MGQAEAKQEKKLMQDYRLNKAEINSLRASYKSSCGERKTLTKNEFRKVYRHMFPGDADEFADEMFRIADADHNGVVDFSEFVRSLCMCDSKNPDEKIRIAFQLYDRDNSGTISRAEVRELLSAYSKLGGNSEDETTKSAILASDFFQQMDADGNDEVTFEEFQEAAKKDPTILSILSPQPPDWQE